jgi:hypothetical protein
VKILARFSCKPGRGLLSKIKQLPMIDQFEIFSGCFFSYTVSLTELALSKESLQNSKSRVIASGAQPVSDANALAEAKQSLC